MRAPTCMLFEQFRDQRYTTLYMVNNDLLTVVLIISKDIDYIIRNLVVTTINKI